jgi:hypothetical protein
VVCEPGVYSLRTGFGPLEVDPDCGSSHCELLTQDNLATLVVVRLCCSAFACLLSLRVSALESAFGPLQSAKQAPHPVAYRQHTV